MKTYKVTVASTIYYQAEIQANNEEEIFKSFNHGEIDFTTWKEIDLDSCIADMWENE